MLYEEIKEQPLKPVLRWVGGKQYLLPLLLEYLPRRPFGTYFEPFLGAASIFLAIRPRAAVLGDANPHLMSMYAHLRRDPLRVAKYLNELANKDSRSTYYSVRQRYNASQPSFAQAGRFLYLNRTCFNGIFRVNTSGQFNVPYGYKKKAKFPTTHELEALAEAFSNARLISGSYSRALASAKAGDFVYMDPPYPPLSGTSYFAHYTMDRFPDDEQEKLAKAACLLSSRGCMVMMSNADTAKVRRLYKGFLIHSLSATRYVTCKARKHRVGEVVITNYD